MKNILTILFAVTLTLVQYSCGSSSNNVQKNETAIYDIRMPVKGINHPDFGIQTIIVDTNKKIHELNFGSSSTESTIEIYYNDTFKNPLITQYFNPNEKKIIDISKLNSGTYRVNATAMAEGCSFLVKIMTDTDNIEFTNLLRDMYKWYEAKGIKSADFDAYTNDSLYIGINFIALKSRLKELNQSNFFTQDFVNNYKRIAQEIDKRLKSGIEKYDKLGYPPWSSGVDPWCNCQDGSSEKYWNIIITQDIKINADSASLNWTWGNNFLYHVKLRKEDNAWKISYLEGLDFDSFFSVSFFNVKMDRVLQHI